MKKKIFILIFLSSIVSMKSQVLISLLFGDKLNKPGIEFGLDGGVNYSTVSNVKDSRSKARFNLGFYFKFKLKNPDFIIATGVIVKSTMGVTGLPVYSLNNSDLDSALRGGKVDKKIGYFNVPVLLSYNIWKGFHFAGGIQLGLLTKVTDEFYNTVDGGEIVYSKNSREGFQPLDAGVTADVGYRFPGAGAMHFSIRYYYGLVDITQDKTGPKNYNSALYLTAGLPIGLGKAQKKQAAKEAGK